MTKGGSLTLPAKKLYEIVKSLPETEIRIAEEKGGVKVVVVGVDELVVIASPQGVFVAPRSRASEVKDIIGD